MSAKGPPNLRHWVWWGIKKARKLGCKEKFELAPKTENEALL